MSLRNPTCSADHSASERISSASRRTPKRSSPSRSTSARAATAMRSRVRPADVPCVRRAKLSPRCTRASGSPSSWRRCRTPPLGCWQTTSGALPHLLRHAHRLGCRHLLGPAFGHRRARRRGLALDDMGHAGEQALGPACRDRPSAPFVSHCVGAVCHVTGQVVAECADGTTPSCCIIPSVSQEAQLSMILPFSKRLIVIP